MTVRHMHFFSNNSENRQRGCRANHLVTRSLRRRHRGFSLIESVVVVGIIALAATGVLGALRASQGRTQLAEGQASVLRAFELARSRAVTGLGSDDHGVHVAGDTLTIFEGETYTGGGQEIRLPAMVTTDQASTTIVYRRLSAGASSGATIEISHAGGATSSVVVTQEGAIIPSSL